MNIKIKLQERNGLPFQIRKNGNVPIVIYGKGINIGNMMIEEKDIQQIIRTLGIHYLSTFIDLEINDKVIYKGIIKDISQNPLTDSIVHVDFFIPDDNLFVSKVPLIVNNINICDALKAKGVLFIPNKNIKIINNVKNFIKEITVDIAKLARHEIIYSSDNQFHGIKFYHKNRFPIVCIK